MKLNRLALPTFCGLLLAAVTRPAWLVLRSVRGSGASRCTRAAAERDR